MKRRITLVLAWGFIFTTAACAAEHIWIEGEDAQVKNVTRHGWYHGGGVAKEGMSGNEWLSHYDAAKAGTAKYGFEAKEGGDYTFWVRVNPFKAKLSFDLNGAGWQSIDSSAGNVRGNLMVSKNPDHRFLGWIKIGTVKLNKGKNAVAFKLDGSINHSTAIDCFVFTNGSFIPSGASKPGAEAATGEIPDPNAVWVEGEDAVVKDVTRHGWYHSGGVAKENMSGHEWLSHYDNAKAGTAKYSFEVKKDGEYNFWMRVNPFKAKLSYKLDEAEWQPIDSSAGNVRGNLMVSKNPDHRFLGWIKIGKVTLKAGKHALAVKLDGSINHSSAIDCFTFADTSFVPSGAQKPTISVSQAGPDSWFKVIADDDAFSDKSIIDLSKLVPAPAGQFGFLQRQGKDLRFEKASGPVKFWGTCAGPDPKFNRTQLTQKCRLFRKYGINMVRQHPVFGLLGPMHNGEFDKAKLDRWDWWFAELKKHGIYMTWSIFYPLRITAEDGYPPELLAELEKGRDGTYSTYGVVNMSRQLQDLQIKYAKALLNHVNPYTKMAYKDDPALAVLEMHNEDCIFFHMPMNLLATPGKKFPKHGAMFRRMFRDWAQKKYKTDEALRAAWGTNDSFARDEFRGYGAWQMNHDRKNVDSKKKLADFIQFCTELQRGFYDRRYKEYREAGYKGVIVTTAWQAGGEIANAANLYCDDAADMIDRHNYFGGGAGGHRITKGKVNNATHMGMPGGGIPSVGLFQVEDKPFACTEWTSKPPNQWKAEMAPLFAFYCMGLQGWDASYHFAGAGNRIGDGWPGLSSYVTATPHYIGQFPALAFALYKHHIEEGPIAAARRLKVSDVYSGDDPLQIAYSATGGAGADEKVAKGEATPNEVLAIGRVTVSFDGKASEKVDWSQYWDKGKKIIKSMTGQLVWDYGKRVVTLCGPKTHAIVGFAGGQTFDLPGVKVNVKTPFCSLLFTPLDDKPLAESTHILITAMAQDKQANSQYNADGTQLLQIGGPPLLMEPVQAKIKFKGPAPRSVKVVDIYGVPTDKEVKTSGSTFSIDGTYKTYYYEVNR